MAFDEAEYNRKYKREWLVRRRMEWIDKNGPCKVCGSNKNLEVDHVNRKKKKSHRIWGWAKKRRLAELKKCQVLCRPCHQKKTFEEMGYGLVHGKSWSYNKYRCRCELCSGAVKKIKERYNCRVKSLALIRA